MSHRMRSVENIYFTYYSLHYEDFFNFFQKCCSFVSNMTQFCAVSVMQLNCPFFERANLQ